MMVSSLLVAGFLAMGPQWSVVDLPYPEVNTSESMGGYAQAPESPLSDTIAAWAKRIAPGRKPEVSELRIDGTKASARVVLADKAWVLRLERVGEEWRVVEK